MYSPLPRLVAIASPGTGRAPTLMQAWEEYQKVRTLRSSTSQNYKEAMQNSFRDWADMPMTTITRSMVLERYLDLCLRGEPTANREMRFLKALFNFAIGYFEDNDGQPLIPANPVRKLSDVRAWKEVRRRQTMVFRQQLKKWLAGVYTMRNDASRDMALMLWLTGCRVGEARNLKWDDVDLETGLVTFRDTKNGTDYVLPLSRFLWNLLLSRRARAPLGNDYIFPGQKPGQPMGNNYKGYSEMCKRIGCAWKFHDLRRGFISLAVMLDINEITVKRLVNHSQRNDVTAGYVVLDPEDLREAMERITEKFLELAGHTVKTQNVELRFCTKPFLVDQPPRDDLPAVAIPFHQTGSVSIAIGGVDR